MVTNAADTDNFNTEFFSSQGMVHTSDNSVDGSAIKYFNDFDITAEVANVHKSGELADWISRGRSVGDAYGFNTVFRYRVNDRITLLTGYNAWFSDITDREGNQQFSKLAAMRRVIFTRES